VGLQFPFRLSWRFGPALKPEQQSPPDNPAGFFSLVRALDPRVTAAATGLGSAFDR
jgi:hypothetical protein